MLFTRTHGIDIDSWYGHGLKVQILTYGIIDTHGMDMDSWYRHGLMNHTHTRGPSVA